MPRGRGASSIVPIVGIAADYGWLRERLDRSPARAMTPESIMAKAAKQQSLASVPGTLVLVGAGKMGGAMLDVFREEPLPPSHAFWRHPKIIVTPHVAAPTIVDTAEQQVIANIERLERGEMPIGVVSRERGY